MCQNSCMRSQSKKTAMHKWRSRGGTSSPQRRFKLLYNTCDCLLSDCRTQPPSPVSERCRGRQVYDTVEHFISSIARPFFVLKSTLIPCFHCTYGSLGHVIQRKHGRIHTHYITSHFSCLHPSISLQRTPESESL